MKISRREMLQISSGVCATTALVAQGRPAAVHTRRSESTPNLLFFLTDQQRRDTMAAYGNRQIQTPSLNKLAAESVVFEFAYVTQPVCTPSRACLMTGLYPHTDGITTNNVALGKDIPVLVEMLPKGKYHTAYFGKWHLGNEICRQHGFDEFESTEDIYEEYSKGQCDHTRSGYAEFLLSHGLKPDLKGAFSRDFANALPKELSKAAYVAQKAIQFMKTHQHQPWVLYVSFLDPHPPFSGPNDNLYDPVQMPVSSTFLRPLDPTVIPETKARRQWEIGRSKEYLGSVSALQKFTAKYWGKVTLVDEMAGRVLESLARLGLDGQTVVSYTSDHGEMLGSHKMIQKSVMYDQATTVPLLLRIPWASSPSARVKTPVSQIDLVPTLLDLLGQKLPLHLQGKSWAPSLLSGSDVDVRDVVIEWNISGDPTEVDYRDRLRTIVTPEGWKLTLTGGSIGELYHRNRDPDETTNLFYQQEMLPTIRDLTHRLNLWQRSTGDQQLVFDENDWHKQRA